MVKKVEWETAGLGGGGGGGGGGESERQLASWGGGCSGRQPAGTRLVLI